MSSNIHISFLRKFFLQGLLIFIFSQVFTLPALAQTPSACSSVRAGGVEYCTEIFNECVQRTNNPSGCGPRALQYGQDQAAYHACFQRNPNNTDACASLLANTGRSLTAVDAVPVVAQQSRQPQENCTYTPDGVVIQCDNQNQPSSTQSTRTPASNTSGVQCIYANSEGPAVPPDANGACPQGTQPRLNGQAANQSTGNITYVPLEPIPGLNLNGNTSFGTLLNFLFETLITLAGFIAIGSFVYGGIQYMFSEVPGIKVDAKKRIRGSLIGLAVLLGCWLILYTINPQLVMFSGSLNPTQTTYTVPQRNANPSNPQSMQLLTPEGQAAITQAQQAINQQTSSGQVTSAETARILQSAQEAERAQQENCAAAGGNIYQGVGSFNTCVQTNGPRGCTRIQSAQSANSQSSIWCGRRN